MDTKQAEHGTKPAPAHHAAPGKLVQGTVVPQAHDHGEASFSPFDMTYAAPHIFWLVLSFGLLFLMLWKVILPRLASTLEERNDRIADDLDQAARMKSDAQDADKAYENALADSKAKAHAIAAETRAKLEAEIDRETAEAEASFAKQAAIAEAQIREATEKALNHVNGVAEKATAEIITKLSGTAPTAASVKQAVKSAAS
ncbi:hypothetical protein MNBD_ALPHA06-883 [hydrothermal vent metagenome]|uniref:ATP synthase F0 sector subunit b n=1 Tax=hydrothermal vent metagenome TaxID=652676 RepID=A0A3B0S1N1_9ZZZZ